jgi:hypothetical protein
MTEQKHLKRRVRSRMEQTDESYVTARRHVLAGRPDGDAADESTTEAARPAGMLASWPACGGRGEHDSGLAAHLLASSGTVAPHTGEPYSQPMMVGLAGGIGFMYATFSYAGGMYTTLTLVARHHPEPYLPAAVRRTGANLVEQHGSTPGPAEKRLRKLLDAGSGAVCTVVRGRLPWHGAQPHVFTTTDVPVAPDEPYNVGVCGLDEAGNLLVDDGAETPYAMGMAEFVEVWAAPKKSRFALFSVPEPKRDLSVEELAAAARDAVATTCAHLTGPVLGHAFDVNFGFSGMGKLADQLADPAGKEGWARRFAEPTALFYAVHRLHDCLGVEYTGPAGTRPLWAEFLDESAGVLAEAGSAGDADRWRDAAAEVRASGEQWSGLVADALAAHPAFEAYGQPADGEDAAERARRLAATYADDPLPAPEVRALLDRLAERVRTAQAHEERAVALLS